MLDVLDHLEKAARFKKSKSLEIISTIRGIWVTNYILRLSEQESIFNLNYILVQTVGQGCSYFNPVDDQPIVDESLIGKNIFETQLNSTSLRIAALDAYYCSLDETPNTSQIINGTNFEKAQMRAEIVCREAMHLLLNRQPKRGKRFTILNVGVVGSFLSILKSHKSLGLFPDLEIDITASDFYKGITNTIVHGTRIEHGTYGCSTSSSNQISFGARTLELIAEADVAIVTGMTLANGTLGGILEKAFENSTALVIFAETGAHFASEYCRLGVNTVVSEPFPFYLTSNGQSVINIYRTDRAL